MRRRKMHRGGFTLLELLLALSIMVVATTVTYLAFSTATTAWRRGIVLTDNLHHGDFVMDQLCMGLRSAYTRQTAGKRSDYGFWMEDRGSGEYSQDIISWVKLGGALVGKDSAIVGSPHRVIFTVDDDDDGESSIAVKAWRIFGQPEDFDYEELEPFFLSKRVIGFNCRPAYPWREDLDEEIEWLDEWENTNSIPNLVELTLFLAPTEEDGDAVELRRVVEVPAAHLSLPKTPWDLTGGSVDESDSTGPATGTGPATPTTPTTPTTSTDPVTKIGDLNTK